MAGMDDATKAARLEALNDAKDLYAQGVIHEAAYVAQVKSIMDHYNSFYSIVKHLDTAAGPLAAACNLLPFANMHIYQHPEPLCRNHRSNAHAHICTCYLHLSCIFFVFTLFAFYFWVLCQLICPLLSNGMRCVYHSLFFW